MLSSQNFLISYSLEIKPLILALCLSDCRDSYELYYPEKLSWGCGITEPITNTEVFNNLKYNIPFLNSININR